MQDKPRDQRKSTMYSRPTGAASEQVGAPKTRSYGKGSGRKNVTPSSPVDSSSAKSD